MFKRFVVALIYERDLIELDKKYVCMYVPLKARLGYLLKIFILFGDYEHLSRKFYINVYIKARRIFFIQFLINYFLVIITTFIK